MDAHQSPSINETLDDGYSDYSDYYSLEAALDHYEPCQKKKAKEFGRVFLPAFYSVTCLLSFVYNLGLICVFIKYKSLRKLLPLNMVVCDLLFTLTLPFWAVYAAGEWVFGHHACRIITLVYTVGLYGSNIFLACMILQKYVDAACVFLGCLDRLVSVRRNVIACVSIWMLTLLASAPHLNFVEAHEFEGQKLCTYHFPHNSGWRIYVRFQMLTLSFLAPLVVLLFCTVAIVRLVARSSPDRGRRSRTVTLVASFTVLFFLLWFPYSVVIFLHTLQELHVISECHTSLHLTLAIQATECIAFMHVCLNPVAYVLLNKKVRGKLSRGCTAPREYLLNTSNSNGSSQDSDVELKALQMNPRRESDLSNAERQGHLLPQVT